VQLGGNDHGIEFQDIDISPTPIKCPNNILKLHEIVYFDAGKKSKLILKVKFLSGALKLHEIFHNEKCNVIPEVKFQNKVLKLLIRL
jgi:hypothetical protein